MPPTGESPHRRWCYPGTTFIDHLLRYKVDPECKMLFLLREVGGIEEYHIIEAVKDEPIKKPIVASGLRGAWRPVVDVSDVSAEADIQGVQGTPRYPQRKSGDSQQMPGGFYRVDGLQ
ncbi:hypothetical protein D9611_012408 [Ephemerocybe angulata]|uniref:Uncharacterized protein n=1 Tax=Ephemerocybe angulata TaxID=980116 RepID=A0A8H5FKF3_9AGAR|nr:hypothetical protein D9611_012408 [Tulosesus angulatus]